MKLTWTEPSSPNNECHYNHTQANTPFGRFLLTWKGWKDYQDFGFDETPWGEVVYLGWGSISEAQEWAEQEMHRRVSELLEGGQ